MYVHIFVWFWNEIVVEKCINVKRVRIYVYNKTALSYSSNTHKQLNITIILWFPQKSQPPSIKMKK